jgi:hypothetical protein
MRHTDGIQSFDQRAVGTRTTNLQTLQKEGATMTDGQVFVTAGLAALIGYALLEHAWLKWRDRKRRP